MLKHSFSTFTTQSQDTTPLHGNYLLPVGKPIAVIYFIHGLGEHSGRFLQQAILFAQNNIASIGIDLRGNGLSGGKKGHANSLQKYIQDIEACVNYGKQFFSDQLAKIIMGNSMGGAIALHYSITHKNMFSGLILTAPWLRLTRPIRSIQHAALNLINKLHPGYTFTTKGRSTALLNTANKINTEQTDPLIHKQITARLCMIIHQLGNQLLYQSDYYLPTLILHSTNDPVTDYKASQYLCNKHSLACKLVTLDEHIHEVTFEKNNIAYTEALRHINKILLAHEQLQD